MTPKTLICAATHLQSLLEGEDMNICSPLMGTHYHHMGLLMKTKQEGELINIAQGGEGV